MAHSLSAKKRARQNLKRKSHNQSIKSSIRTQLKKTRSILEPKKDSTAQAIDKESLMNELKKISKLIDKAVNKKIMHKNQAARLKSRLSLAVNKI